MSASPLLHWHQLPHAPAPGTALGHIDELPDGVATLRELDTGGGPNQPFRLLLRSGADVRAYVNRLSDDALR